MPARGRPQSHQGAHVIRLPVGLECEELVEYNAAAGVTKPRYERAREPHIFLPAEVEAIRVQLDLRDRTLVSVLAYSGPRPEEVVCRLAWRRRQARNPLPGPGWPDLHHVAREVALLREEVVMSDRTRWLEE